MPCSCNVIIRDLFPLRWTLVVCADAAWTLHIDAAVKKARLCVRRQSLELPALRAISGVRHSSGRRNLATVTALPFVDNPLKTLFSRPFRAAQGCVSVSPSVKHNEVGIFRLDFCDYILYNTRPLRRIGIYEQENSIQNRQIQTACACPADDGFAS